MEEFIFLLLGSLLGFGLAFLFWHQKRNDEKPASHLIGQVEQGQEKLEEKLEVEQKKTERLEQERQKLKSSLVQVQQTQKNLQEELGIEQKKVEQLGQECQKYKRVFAQAQQEQKELKEKLKIGQERTGQLEEDRQRFQSLFAQAQQAQKALEAKLEAEKKRAEQAQEKWENLEDTRKIVGKQTDKVFKVLNSSQIGKAYLEWKFPEAGSEQAKKLSLLGYLGYYMTDQNKDFGKILISSFIAFKQENPVPMSDDEREMWQAICRVSEELGNELELLETRAGEKFSRTGMVALDGELGRKVKEFYAFGCKGGPRPLVSVE